MLTMCNLYFTFIFSIESPPTFPVIPLICDAQYMSLNQGDNSQLKYTFMANERSGGEGLKKLNKYSPFWRFIEWIRLKKEWSGWTDIGCLPTSQRKRSLPFQEKLKRVGESEFPERPQK